MKIRLTKPSPLTRAQAELFVGELASHVQLVVPATANLFGAGHPTLPAPIGGGAGTRPLEIDLPAGLHRVLTFADIAGIVNFGDSINSGPDGIKRFGGLDGVDSLGGLAGTLAHVSRYLSGVFLGDSEPSGNAPNSFVVTDTNAPAYTGIGLDRLFFIGDGLANGVQQVFDVPDDATRLFLGFQDSRGEAGLPGLYGNNKGSMTVTVDVE